MNPAVPHATLHFPVGTYGCVRTGGFVGWAIRVITQSRYNHAFVVVGEDQIVEARPSGAAIGRISAYRNDLQCANDDEVDTYSNAQQLQIAKAALALVGTPYGFLDILSVGLLQYGVKWGWVRNRVQNSNQLICSQLVDKAYLNAGLHLFDDGRLPQDVTPGDLADRITREVWK